MIYTYKCKKHGQFDLFRYMKDHQDNEPCPKCKKLCNQVFYSPPAIVIKEPSTLGSLAERNTKKMGKYELQERSRKDRLAEVKRKYQPSIDMGILPPDYKLPDPDTPPPFGQIDKNVKKNLFKGTKKEQRKKIKKYIEKGTL